MDVGVVGSLVVRINVVGPIVVGTIVVAVRNTVVMVGGGVDVDTGALDADCRVAMLLTCPSDHIFGGLVSVVSRTRRPEIKDGSCE